MSNETSGTTAQHPPLYIEKCKICGREAADKLCDLHGRAYRNLVEKYDAWRSALDISWKEYLSEVVRNPYIGSWAKEVAEHLLSEREPDSS